MAFLQCSNGNCKKYFNGKEGTKYCSSACKNQARLDELRGATREVVCANPKCGRKFLTSRKDKRYCCLLCKKEYEHDKYLESVEMEEKYCARMGCTVKFIGNKKQKYCCKYCAEIAKRERDNERKKNK